MPSPEIRPLTPDDFEATLALWKSTEGLGNGPGDSVEALSRFLERNRGLSLVATDGKIVGALLCGHDGRRGLIYHLAVAPAYRRQNLAREMVRSCFSALKAHGIERCLILVQGENKAALEFWKAVGCRARPDLAPLSIDI